MTSEVNLVRVFVACCAYGKRAHGAHHAVIPWVPSNAFLRCRRRASAMSDTAEPHYEPGIAPDSETVAGGCHCGSVRWKAQVKREAPIIVCNCSRCSKLAYLHLIVDRHELFQLETPSEALTEYRFNTGTAKHLFCSKCGVQSFYVPRSHPEGVSLNARCLDGGVPEGRGYKDFDGRNWEASISTIR